MTVVAIAAAGAVGALARLLVDRAVERRVRSVLPIGTFVVNAVGSLVLGIVIGLVPGDLAAEPAALIIGVGFCGAFTTFSTFAVETLRLSEDESSRHGAAYALGSVAVCLAVAAVGLVVGAALSG